MQKKYLLVIVFYLFSRLLLAQEYAVQVETKELPNRLAFYALNENEVDLDVKLEVKGTNFRQSRAKPRFIRVPAASRVFMKTIVLMRGKKPAYTLNVVVRDSLSSRALKKEFEAIKIQPKKPIVIYIPESCTSCDSLLTDLENGKYKFRRYQLADQPDMKAQLQRAFGNSILLDSLKTPVVNLGGRLYTKILDYTALMEALQKETP